MNSCSTSKTAANNNSEIPIGDTSENSLDWAGTYLLESEDASLPSIQLKLNADKTFEGITTPIDSDRNTYFKGTFQWQNNGTTIELSTEIPYYQVSYLLVGEQALFILEEDGTKAENLTHLKRINKLTIDDRVTEKYWKLTAINGRKVTENDFSNKEPHLLLKSEFNAVRGTDGCNGFGGIYSIEEGTITFKQMISTLMACPDSFVFEKYMKILNNRLEYEVNDKELTLTHGQDKLSFEVVYLK